MASDYTPINVTSGYEMEVAINLNFTAIKQAMDKALNREVSSDNAMQQLLDMNNFNIINLPAPGTLNSPLRLQDLENYIAAINVDIEDTSVAALIALSGRPAFSTDLGEIGENVPIGSNITEAFQALDQDITTIIADVEALDDSIVPQFASVADMITGTTVVGATVDFSIATTGIEVDLLGYYSSGDGGDGEWKTITTGTTANVDLPNGINIIQSTSEPTTSFFFSHNRKVDILKIGAKADDITFDNSPLITHAFRNMRAKEVLVNGTLYLNTSCDLTELSEDSTGRLTLTGIAGGTASNDVSDKLIFNHNGLAGLDLSGSSRMIVKNLGMVAEGTNSPLIGLYLQRTETNKSCKRHVFRDLRIEMKISDTGGTINGGHGYLGFYLTAAEDNSFENVTVIADSPHFLTLQNRLSKTSTFAGGFTNPDITAFTCSNNRYKDSSTVSNKGNSPFFFDGITGVYVEGGFHSGRNFARLVTCAYDHSRLVYFKDCHCEDIGAVLTYSATSSIGFDPTTFEFKGGQIIGTDLNTGDRWDGMVLITGSNITIRGILVDIPTRPGSNVIDYIKTTGTNINVVNTRVNLINASPSYNTFDGTFFSGDLTATNLELNTGDRSSEDVYDNLHTDLRKTRSVRINGLSSVGFADIVTNSGPGNEKFLRDSTLITPASYYLYQKTVNGVNIMKGFITLNAVDVSGTNFKIRLSDAFFPIRSTNPGFGKFNASGVITMSTFTTNVTASVSDLVIPMSGFTAGNLYTVEVDFVF